MIYPDRHNFLLSIFADLHSENIPFCILNPPSSNLAELRDIDIACNKESIARILPSLILSFLDENFHLSRIVIRSYCVQLIFLSPSERVFQIDLMYQFITSFNRIAEAQNLIQDSRLVSGVPYASYSSLESYNKLKIYYSSHIIRFFTPFLDPCQFFSIVHLRFSHLISLLFVHPRRIALLGVDGTGKSTISNIIIQQLVTTLRTPVQFYYLFRGILPRYRPSSTPSTNSSPHSTPQRSFAIQCSKLLYMSSELLLDQLYTFFFPKTWIVFDRYSYDLYLDRVRYGLSSFSSNILKQFIDKISIPPLLLFVLDGDSRVLYNRKKEISVSTLDNLLIGYSDLTFCNILPLKIAISTTRYSLASSTTVVSSLLNANVALEFWR